ncbi:hypothetical protein AOQ84DRAFT_301006, partial [Glonium stellatum]
PINVHLEHFPLDNSSAYEALSYVWGEPSETETISLDRQEIKVTLNLESALRHLRRGDSDKVLWIDAIYIDQNNNRERNPYGHRIG